MNNSAKILGTLALVLLTPVAFACDYPSRPGSLPDGATASKEDMLAGVSVIKAYQEEMDIYLTCIEADEIVAIQTIEDDDQDGKAQSKEMFSKKYNAAVEEQTLVVEEFNAQIRAYKSR